MNPESLAVWPGRLRDCYDALRVDLLSLGHDVRENAAPKRYVGFVRRQTFARAWTDPPIPVPEQPGRRKSSDGLPPSKRER